MILIQAALDYKRVQKELAKLPDKSRKANSMAINTAIRKGRTTVGREIRDKYVIKQGRIYEELSQKFANPGNLYGNLVAKGPGIPVRDFKVTPKGPQPRKKPVLVVEIIKGQAKSFGGAFVVGAFGSHVFTRKGRTRFPIKKRRSVSVPQMMLGERAGEPIKQQISDTYDKEFARQMARVMGGK